MLWVKPGNTKGRSFANRLNDIVPLLSDAWLDGSEKQIKKTLKTIILDSYSQM
jgi:hypothetical protein